MWIIDIAMTGLKALFTGLLSGWFKKDPKDQTIENAKESHEIETKVDNLPAGDASDILHSKWRR